MQLAFIIYAMQAGGAERVLSIMANHLAGKSHDVTLIILEDDSRVSFYDIDARIHQVSLDVAGASKNRLMGILNNFRRIYKLRTAIRKIQADAIISFMTETNVLTLIAAYGLSTPVVVTEHTDPWQASVAGVWKKLRTLLYPRASRTVVLNERAREYFDQSPRIKTMVLPNPVVIEADKDHVDQDYQVGSGHLIIGMGRLSRKKRFDLLIGAYSRVAAKYSDWNLMILGEGPDRESLEALRDELGLNERVILPGAVRTPHVALKRAEMFVSSSELEGFPMALCEAMACGLPVVAAEYHSAVSDIIEDGQNGILVPKGDSEALAATMIHLINDPRERKRLAENSVEIGTRYSVDAVMERWEQLLKEVASPQHQVPV